MSHTTNAAVTLSLSGFISICSRSIRPCKHASKDLAVSAAAGTVW